MPESYRIVLSPKVASDLEGIFNYIFHHSPQNAAAVVDRILTAIEGLKTFPHRTVVQSRRSKQPIRSLPVQSWIVFFKVDDSNQTVRVLRVRHGRRRRPRRME
jgi:toxin ParE1/3/4